LANDLLPHYKTQAGASFWTRPRNMQLSRVTNSYSLFRLNERYNTNFKSKAEAVRRILYDSGFRYDGILPEGALHGDPQFASVYDSGSAITAYGVMREHFERDIKGLGYDCTGRRQTSLYSQALAGNKAAKKSLDAVYHGEFPSRPCEAWAAIEQILHGIYADYLEHYGCPNRLISHPMYPAISPPLPNPVKLRGYVLRARRAHDTTMLSWMLGRDATPRDFSSETAEHLISYILNRFGYTSAEIAAMRSIVGELENSAPNDKESNASEHKKAGGFLFGCILLFSPIAIGFGALSLAGYLMKDHGMVCNILGLAISFGVFGMLVILCRVFRGKKGRPP